MTYAATPTLPNATALLNEFGTIDYTFNCANGFSYCSYLKLTPTSHSVDVLARYAVLVIAELCAFEEKLDAELPTDYLADPEVNVISLIDTHYSNESSAEKWQGWVGEIIADFVVRHLFRQHKGDLNYQWFFVRP